MTQTQHQKVVAWLRDHVGETEHPDGSNRGRFVQSCQAATWLRGSGWPWCVATWVKAWTVAGRKLPYLGAGAYQMLDWYERNIPAWVVPLARARPGAAVILNIGAGHLATLEHPYDGHGLVHTIDGNWGNAVTRVSHPVSQVRGVVDPPEKVTSPIKIAQKPPVYEVVTSASGHKVVYVSGVKAISNKLPQLLKRYGKGIIIRRRPAK
jgi:hypothetical protein